MHIFYIDIKFYLFAYKTNLIKKIQLILFMKPKNDEEKQEKKKKLNLNFIKEKNKNRRLFENKNFNTKENNTIDNIFNLNINEPNFKVVNKYKSNSEVHINSFLIENIHSKDTLTLYELLCQLKKTKITENLFIIIVNKCKDVLFREIKNSNPTGVQFHVGDDVNVKNSVSSNINIFAKILNYVTSVMYDNNIILKVFCDSDILNLINLLKSEDENERAQIANVLLNIFKNFKITIRNVIENELCLFYEGLRTHIGMEELLEVVSCIIEDMVRIKPIKREYVKLENKKFPISNDQSIISNNNFKDKNEEKLKEKNNSFFYEYVLRFLTVNNLEYYTNINQIIFSYCKKNLNVSKITLKYLSVLFQNTQFSNKSVLVQIYMSIYILWSRKISYNEIINDVCMFLNNAFESEHFKLIDQTVKIIDFHVIKKFFKENITEILPKIFDNLYMISKKYWRHKGKLDILKFMFLIINLNHHCFEQCLINYNKKKHLKKSEIFEDLKKKLLKVIESYKIEQSKELIFTKRRKSLNNSKQKKI